MREIRTSGSVGASGRNPRGDPTPPAQTRSILQEGRRLGMERRAKVELFEQLRREYEFGIGSIKGVARKLGVHRRMVRQALANADPPHD